MQITYFLDELSRKSLREVKYNVYLFNPQVHKTINLKEQQDEDLKLKIRNLITHAIKTIGEIISAQSKDSEQIVLELQDMIQIMHTVETQFLTTIHKKAESCKDEYEKKAITKVKMIVEDVFKKFPQLAGDIYHPGM